MEKPVTSYSQIYAGNWNHTPPVIPRRKRVPLEKVPGKPPIPPPRRRHHPEMRMHPRIRSMQGLGSSEHPLYVIWDESPASSEQGDDPPEHLGDEGGGLHDTPDLASRRSDNRYKAPHRWKRTLAPPDSPKMKKVNNNRMSWTGGDVTVTSGPISLVRSPSDVTERRNNVNKVPRRRPFSTIGFPTQEYSEDRIANGVVDNFGRPDAVDNNHYGRRDVVDNYGRCDAVDNYGRRDGVCHVRTGNGFRTECQQPTTKQTKSISLHKQPRSVPSDFGSQVSRRHDSFEGSAGSNVDPDTKHLRRTQSDNTPDVSRYRQFDIVGESYDARFPWQRDVSVQCDMNYWKHFQRPTDVPGVNSNLDKSNSLGSSMTNVCLRRRDNFANRGKPRPNSIGPVENNKYQNELARFRDSYSRRGRKSESSLGLYQSPSPNRTRLPLAFSDDTGSVSDLESILENPDDIQYSDISRHTSLTSYDEDDGDLRYNASELPALTESSDDDRLDILPSPSISPQMWQSGEDFGNQSDSESSAASIDDFETSSFVREDRFQENGWAVMDVDRVSNITPDKRDIEPPKFGVMSAISSLGCPAMSMLVPADITRLIMENSTPPQHDPANLVFQPEISPVPIAPVRRRRKKPQRRLSSGSLTDGSETENEPSEPPVARRGRRSAIFETKNCGDVSPTTLSPEVSPSNSCDEGDGASNIAERLRRRRSSVDLAMNIYPGDLLVQEHHKKLIKRNTIADFYAGRNGTTQPPHQHPPSIAEAPGGTESRDSRKGRQPFSLLKLMKTRSKESLSRLGELLSKIKPSEFKDNHLAAYKNLHWSDLIASSDKPKGCVVIGDTERKRREAVWELFKSECVFLIDHLMVLKHCFMEPLKKLQVEDFLMFAEPQDIFGNLDELCYVSYTFCKDFLSALLKDMSCTEFGRTKILIKAFQRFSAHSKDGAVYHTYCLNYTNALSYLDKLRQNPEFQEYEKWCNQDSRCNRLQLTDLLVAPMQHCTKLPLLLNNIRKYTADEIEKQQVTESLEKVETSLKQLEDKMKWVRNYERVQEIQQLVVWPSVTDLDPRVYIPECLKATLGKQPCEKLLACSKRQLMYEGQITLIETTKAAEVHIFIFDDILLITKVKKTPRKKQSVNDTSTKSPSSGQTDRCTYTVYRQPIALDRFNVHDVSTTDAAASGLKHIFVLVQFSRFQQIIGVYTLQASCDSSKAMWLSQIREAKEKYGERESSRQNSFKENQAPRSETLIRSPRQMKRNTAMRKIHGKSRSMDAMFL